MDYKSAKQLSKDSTKPVSEQSKIHMRRHVYFSLIITTIMELVTRWKQ